ncbi:MAG: hypothetical protein HY747_06795 [Elusimicrobia bacterium]|nr:hypothetical protein [Elusimicrobiota bacterium]
MAEAILTRIEAARSEHTRRYVSEDAQRAWSKSPQPLWGDPIFGRLRRCAFAYVPQGHAALGAPSIRLKTGVSKSAICARAWYNIILCAG